MTQRAFFPAAAFVALMMVVCSAHSEDGQNWITTESGCKVFAPQPIAGLEASWNGKCSNGYAEGEGVLTWNNGHQQQGTLRAGRLEGMLTERWSNGNRYEGEVHAGVVAGRGQFFWASGDWY